MANTGIGFGKAPERTETWNSGMFVFSKTRVSDGVFEYNCTCESVDGIVKQLHRSGCTLFRDLGRAEIEQLRKFTDFIAEHLK
jgi:mannose-1-phosphate guanylyltransferase